MTGADLVRAWKDEDYRLSLTADEMPDHPAGTPDAEIYLTAAGGRTLNTCESYSSCYHLCSAW
ncbi:mersacidin/lichenicidin family type 2 lantibiotic [Actinocatenispora rupis]|uniref:Mersacidin/lichenicidin family type 2 lantibiotic n=1 Tax=Actinocatenispora rupis TaxID=519421 RepID=A0A8J3J2D4_9ACTN|nr:mersacidin/lichenicidin family type 2 lantibiotic [Actinocatenispora rupis]GID10840.1 hypothetical protein Aru02nite_17290 [Actinocatenispora rupis]